MTSVRPVQLIPARSMSVTSIRKRVTLPNGDSVMSPVGWQANCYNCNWSAVFMLHQYAEACKSTRTHDCYRGKDSK